MSKFAQFELNGGGTLPTIAFGTGTTFFDRGDEVADAVVKGIRTGYRVRTGQDRIYRFQNIHQKLTCVTNFCMQTQLLDTAQQYKTERGVGEGIKRAIEEGLVERKDLFVTTKYPPKDQTIEEVVTTTLVSNVYNIISQI